MNKQDSLNFLKQVLNQIENMSQEEFDKRCIDAGLDKQDIFKSSYVDSESCFSILDPRTIGVCKRCKNEKC